METYIALLRGINVSGHNMIKMDELKRVLAGLDFSGITTYIQSGNITFDAEAGNPQELGERIAGKILQHFGLTVPVMIRTLAEMEFVSRNNPFSGDVGRDPEKFHVTFLSAVPGVEREQKIREFNFSPDEFVILGKECYLYCPNGYGQTKLTPQFFESKLKVTTTTRNWKTIMHLVTRNT
ncbi:MAG: DUF1697 domain-containing protein [Bacteroidota bacterium]